MNYFESLSQDMATLGLISDPIHGYAYDYLGTKIITDTISHELRLNKREIESTNLSDLSTEFARRALFLARSGVEFDETFGDCCEEAEPKLLQAIDPDMIANPDYNSPIIVTEGNEPIGVIKRYGVRTLYGIQDVPEHNIVRGAFHKVDDTFWTPLDLPKSTSAWTTPIDDEASRLAVAPVRFSVFNIPLDERLRMMEYERPDALLARIALQGSETEIVHNITDAYVGAMPLAGAKKPLAA